MGRGRKRYKTKKIMITIALITKSNSNTSEKIHHFRCYNRKVTAPPSGDVALEKAAQVQRAHLLLRDTRRPLLAVQSRAGWLGGGCGSN